MFCPNCGGKIDHEEKYCVHCGSELHREDAHAITKPEGKAWFRFLKVIYIVAYVVAVFFAVAVIVSEYPHKTINMDTSHITCSNGETYSLTQAAIYPYDGENTLDTTDDGYARNLCAYGDIFADRYAPSNYTYYPSYTYPDYGVWAIYSLLGLAVLWAVMKLIKIMGLYIIVGEKPKWRKEFSSKF